MKEILAKKTGFIEAYWDGLGDDRPKLKKKPKLRFELFHSLKSMSLVNVCSLEERRRRKLCLPEHISHIKEKPKPEPEHHQQ